MSNAISRRDFLRTAGAGAAAGATMAAARTVAAQPKKLVVSVGRQPFAAGNSPITQYMLNQKLFEKYAAEHGYELTVDYRDYPSAMPQVEAFVSGNLSLGMWGNTPIIRTIAQQQPLTLLNVGEGHFRFVLATRPDSPVRTIQDLKGKTVGALFGGDPYNVLSQMLRHELGSGDPKAHGITIVNTPVAAQAATIPQGMDAAITIYPAFLKAQREAGTVGVMNSFGYTEDYYKGPAGEGAGKLLENVKKSPFYPDGYYLHRSFWVAHDGLVKSHPKVVLAFVLAQQEAVEKLAQMNAGEVSQLVVKYWGLPPEQGAKVVGDEVLFIRGWVWATEGDAWAVLENSKFMVEGKLIEKPLGWAQVKAALAKAAPIMKEAYERSGRRPDAAKFQDKEAKDVRGLPVWEMDRWRDRT